MVYGVQHQLLLSTLKQPLQQSKLRDLDWEATAASRLASDRALGAAVPISALKQKTGNPVKARRRGLGAVGSYKPFGTERRQQRMRLSCYNLARQQFARYQTQRRSAMTEGYMIA
jgi:hypothetical protein